MPLLRILKRCIILLLILFIVFLVFYECCVSTMTSRLAIDHAKLTAYGIINRSVADTIENNELDFSDMVNVVYDQNNNVKSIETNSANINRLKTILNDGVSNYISKYDRTEVGIPIGTYTGIDYFSGMGPEIGVTVHFSGCAITEIVSEFSSAGINQTLHKIYAKVTVDVSLISLGKKRGDRIEYDCLIGETVIVGTAPNTYGNFVKNNL